MTVNTRREHDEERGWVNGEERRVEVGKDVSAEPNEALEHARHWPPAAAEVADVDDEQPSVVGKIEDPGWGIYLF